MHPDADIKRGIRELFLSLSNELPYFDGRPYRLCGVVGLGTGQPANCQVSIADGLYFFDVVF
jgi:hypothetical protein